MFRANPEIVATLGPVMQRIIKSGRQPALTVEALYAAKAYYAANPGDSEDVLFCADGRLVPAAKYTRYLQSRTGQLVFIAEYGFPMVIGRNTAALWDVA